MDLIVRELARAKVNLTLRVLGRRPDGYHELESLVVFAETADEIQFTPGPAAIVETSGPFAQEIDSENLVAKAMRLALELEPRLQLGHVRVVKNLPVAAGLGGGSADAAATLRALRAANPDFAGTIDWRALAARLGADVTVCVENRPALMSGTGELVVPLAAVARLPMVLVNPRVPVPQGKTRAVFKVLEAPEVAGEIETNGRVGGWPTAKALLAHLASSGNDLETAATQLMPEIAVVMQALRVTPGARLVRLSGSGPTCFALYTEAEAAAEAAEEIACQYPEWWVTATRIA